MTTEFPIRLLEVFAQDIFGAVNSSTNEVVREGLINKELLYPTRIHLKRLGNEFIKEHKLLVETVEEVKKTYYEVVEDKWVLKKDVDPKEVNEKMNEIYSTKISITHHDFVLEDFPVRTKETYELLDFWFLN